MSTACLYYSNSPHRLRSINKSVRFDFSLDSPWEEASSCTFSPLFLISGTSFPGNKTTEVLITRICCNDSSPLSSYFKSNPLSCNVNSFQAKQEVIFLLIGWIPAVSRSVLSAGRPGGSTERMTERERKNAGQPLSTVSSLSHDISPSAVAWECLCVCRFCAIFIALVSVMICTIEFHPPCLLRRPSQDTHLG